MKSIAEKLKALGGVPSLPDAKEHLCKDELTLQLVTPMVGGGVEKGEVDTTRPIRASSIRGHLRYWWRLLCAGDRKGDELRKAETDIWGGICQDTTEGKKKKKTLASKVFVRVDCESIKDQNLRHYDKKDQPFEFGEKNPTELYALFPVQKQKDEKDSGHNIAKEGLSFKLSLRYPQDFQKQIRMALAAWIYFGGIGARTRRGCGTLYCEKTELDGGGALPGIHDILAANRKISLWKQDKPFNDALRAWKAVLGVYKDYRQQRNEARGRSHWPEPDTLRLRKFTGQSNFHHKEAITSPLPSFPRAALGLPIIFHFISPGDPSNVTLIANDMTISRMSSPVITKAICEDGKRDQWKPVVILLPHEHALKIVPCTGYAGDSEIIGVKDQRYVNAKYQPTQGKDNAIEGFEKYIEQKRFKREGGPA